MQENEALLFGIRSWKLEYITDIVSFSVFNTFHIRFREWKGKKIERDSLCSKKIAGKTFPQRIWSGKMLQCTSLMCWKWSEDALNKDVTNSFYLSVQSIGKMRSECRNSLSRHVLMQLEELKKQEIKREKEIVSCYKPCFTFSGKNFHKVS